MKEITLEAVVENLDRVTQFVGEQLEAYGCSPRAQMQIDIAIDELFGNIAHGGEGGAAGGDHYLYRQRNPL